MPVYSIKFSGILNKTKAFLKDCNDSMHIALDIKKIEKKTDLHRSETLCAPFHMVYNMFNIDYQCRRT